MSSRLGRTRRLWRAVRRRLPGLRRAEPPPDPQWPDEEPSLVPVGAPRGRPPAASVALEPPPGVDGLEYPTETDAVGREDDDGEIPSREAL